MLALRDRSAISKQAEYKRNIIQFSEREYDIITFLYEHKQIFNNKKILKSIIIFTKNLCLLRRTYNTKYREEIIKKIKPNTKEYKDIVYCIKKGFTLLHASHLQFYVSLLWGYQSFEELTQTKIIKQGHRISRNGKIYNIDVPINPMPISFVLHIHKILHIQIPITTESLISHGYHNFSALIGTLDTYYQLSI